MDWEKNRIEIVYTQHSWLIFKSVGHIISFYKSNCHKSCKAWFGRNTKLDLKIKFRKHIQHVLFYCRPLFLKLSRSLLRPGSCVPLISPKPSSHFWRPDIGWAIKNSEVGNPIFWLLYTIPLALPTGLLNFHNSLLTISWHKFKIWL